MPSVSNGRRPQPAAEVVAEVEVAHQSEAASDEGRSNIFAIIDGRRLERECFIRSIELLHRRLVVVGYSSIDACVSTLGATLRPQAIILNIGSRLATDPTVSTELRQLVDGASGSPVVVLAESEEFEQMLAVLDCGARGYVPASVGIDAIIEATVLTSSGGIFLSSSSLASLRNSVAPRVAATLDFGEQLTARQSAVAEALRRGKPNKIIAYEMNMCESTVKVHIRNILKKLDASNRTEAAFKLNAIHAAKSGPHSA